MRSLNSNDDELILKQTVKHTRVIALIAGLLLFAGQLSSVLHAAEHLFHAPSEICASFISMEQQDLAVTEITLAADFPLYSDEFKASHQLLELSSCINSNRARAPPLFT